MAHEIEIARAFVNARGTAAVLPHFPGNIPGSLNEAYDIQNSAILLTDKAIAGWKVGRINPPFDRALGSNRLTGPIFADVVRDGRETVPSMTVFAGGFCAVEVEFLLQIGSEPDPDRTAWTINDTLKHIDTVHIGLEIASSPFPGINDLGPLVTISDFGNNHGLVIGDALEEWRDHSLMGRPVRLEINDAIAGESSADKILDGPFGAARWLFEDLATRGIALRSGQWISSGAITGVHEVVPGASVTATIGHLAVRCSIASAEPRK